MAETAIVTRPKPTEIDVIIVDATVGGSHDGSATVTDHPVEEGSDVSDHSRPEPDRLTLDCIVSNTTLSAREQRIVQQGDYRFATTVPGLDPERARQAYDWLRDIKDTGRLIDVVTALRSYERMAIESMSVPISSAYADALRFSLRLKQVRIVKNKLTRIVVAEDSRAQPKIKTGNQTTKQPPADVDPLRSIGQGIGEALSGSSNETLSNFGNSITSAVAPSGR